jgi:hypothetical protein
MIVSSVITLPDRTDDFIKTLDELLLSTIIPDFLYVSISRFYPRLNKSIDESDIEKISEKLKNYPIKNRIVFYDQDIGPCLKLLTPLKEHNLQSDDQILIFDDDNGLFPTAIECLKNIHDKCGSDSVYGIMGIKDDKFVHGEFVNGDYHTVDLLGGYRGVLYPSNILNYEELYNWVNMFIDGYKLHDMIAMHDDHIFSYYLKYKNIESRVVNVYPRYEGWKINYWPKTNSNGIFQYERVQESIEVLDEVLKNNNISL